MKDKIEKKNRIISIIIAIAIITYSGQVKAGDTTITGNIGSGSSSGVSGYYDALWSGHLYEFEFRVTLVDENGEKVKETNSVDYGYNNDPKTYRLLGNELTNKISNAIGYNYSTNTYNYEYKYGTNTENYSYYKAKLANGNYYNYYDQYELFVKEFQTMIKNRTRQFGIENNTTGSFDFLTMFLYHCGYLKSDDGNYYDIDDDKWLVEKIKIANSNYYLLIEPIFTISGKYSKHGTSNEMAKFLINTGTIPYGLMSAFTYTLGIGMNTNANEIQNLGFNRVKYGDPSLSVSTFKKGGATNEQVINQWKITSNEEYGYGVGVLKISTEIFGISNVPELMDVYFSKNFCTQTSEANNTGKINFELNNNLEATDFKKMQEAGYKYEKYKSSNGEIYCYDDVTYDFSNLINNLNNTIVKQSTNIDIPNGTVTVNRHCMVYSPNTEYGTAKSTFLDDFSEYENQSIPLNIYGKTIELKKKTIEKTDDVSNESKLNKGISGKNGLYNITATITFGYADNDSKLYIDKNFGDGTASIDLSGVTFGYSNDLKSQVEDGQVYTYNNFTFNTHVTSNTENYICSFKATVEPPTPPTTDTSVIQFRTIDLDNPFPARDGSSRLPGSNWLGKDNYVRTYINHNRGVSGNEVYNKEPIYTITLTPSTMIKIREYNKKHKYSEIVLGCKGENNTECFSEFLGDNKYIAESDKTGTCMAVTANNLVEDPLKYKDYPKWNLVDNILDIADEGTLTHNYTNSELKFDYNKDGMLTLRDAYIYDEAEKTTNYYTCADKTYENSGYIRKGQK